MHIRQATTDDTDIIYDIGCRSYRHNFLNIWTPEGIEKHIDQGFTPEMIANSLSQPDSNIWFLISASPSSSPLGYASLIKNSPVPGIEFTKPALELRKLYFLPEASGQGFGKQLMDFIVNFAEENNYPTLWLDVLKSNEGAIRFYQRSGFEQVGSLHFKTDVREVGQWVMIKKIAI